ncbi:MAG: prolyl oligopeptidase family serine peptidase [Planctomycetaceae bacterium]|nr:prolyl oligopeptidase family serine peptidase [Planctomycetaceae bacterium]MCB9950876.1 prolyl oligopeptidase family serine peptidase [Planctomycetaceae bacterium]
MSFSCRCLLAGMLMLVTGVRALADDAQPVKSLILPGESFLIDERPAFIMWPEESKRQSPQPWVMYGPTLPAYPDVHEKWMHEQFLAAGVAVAGVDIGEAYGSPTSQEYFTKLYDHLTSQRGFAKKPCLLGRSRGGLWVSSWAIRNTDKVAGLAGIYPVFDLTTYPGLERAAPAYGMTPKALEASLAEHNPIKQVDALANAKVPVFIIHGDEDKVVPLKENTATLFGAYQYLKAEDAIEVVIPKGQGHNFWPGFFHCQDLVDFTIRQAKIGAGLKPGKETSSTTVTYRDLEYSRAGDLPLLLDLYRPRNSDEALPVVVWVHGGGWKNGSKERCPATWLTEHGYAIASINYRLTDQGQWPAQIDDCRAAIRWLRQNANEFKLDRDHIAAWGGSAGGHLVALLGTLDAPSNESDSSRVQAVCDWYGPTDLLTMPPNVLSDTRTLEDIANSNGAKLLGATVRDVPDLAKQASALYQVSSDDPPFLIMHGEKDPGVPLEQSERLHQKLKESGVESTFHIVPGAGHGGKEFQTPEVREMIRAYFDKHLKASE